jgi:hypothetical protein
MLTATMFRLFGLTAREQVFHHQDNTMPVKTHHITYHTSISCTNDPHGIDTEIHVYSPPLAILMEDFTIIYIRG